MIKANIFLRICKIHRITSCKDGHDVGNQSIQQLPWFHSKLPSPHFDWQGFKTYYDALASFGAAKAKLICKQSLPICLELWSSFRGAVIAHTIDLTSSDVFPTFPVTPTISDPFVYQTISYYTFTSYLLRLLLSTPFSTPLLHHCSDSQSLSQYLLSIATPTLTITYSIYLVLTNYYK